MKILVGKRNSYEYPGSSNPGPWGQYLEFNDGSVEFDADHQQSEAIEAATQQATGDPDATFVPGIVGKDNDVWVPA
jgi:hypothetical protein